MSDKPLSLLVERLVSAVARLQSALSMPKNEYIRDSAIQRFEFTFELTWKVLKAFLELKGLQARSPRDAIRGAFQSGMIPEDPGWLEMISLRNLTSHTDDEEVAEKIYGELPAMLRRFQDLTKKLNEILSEESG